MNLPEKLIRNEDEQKAIVEQMNQLSQQPEEQTPQ